MLRTRYSIRVLLFLTKDNLPAHGEKLILDREKINGQKSCDYYVYNRNYIDSLRGRNSAISRNKSMVFGIFAFRRRRDVARSQPISCGHVASAASAVRQPLVLAKGNKTSKRPSTD